MQAYFFLSTHPKFGSVLKAIEKSGAKRRGCKKNWMNDIASPVQLDSSHKLLSSAIINSIRPVGRDSAKKAKETDFVVNKVTEGIAKAIAPANVGTSSLKNLEDSLSKAKEIMQTMANHQVMVMAPSEI